MIIDSHVHLWSGDFIAKPFWDSLAMLFSTHSGKPVEVIAERMPSIWDETGDSLIEDMNNAGIDRSWASALDLGLLPAVGEAKYSITEINRRCAEVYERFKGRIIAFVSVDPRRDEAAELLETGVKNWGMRGLKLLPACGFYPNDENCYKLYKKAAELGIPVLVHTGPEAAPLYSKYCYPIYLDEVANDFPELTIIAAHAGFCWWPEALSIAGNRPNIYLDLAGWQPRAVRHTVDEFYKPLRMMIDAVGSSRILFGSDWSAFRSFEGGQTGWVNVFKELPGTAKDAGIAFTQDEIDAILGENAARILGE